MELQHDSQQRIQTLREILRQGLASTQDDLCKALRGKKFVVTQSTISRDLRRIGAVKMTSPEGQTMYRLPDEMNLAPMTHPLSGLLRDIQANETMIVLHTSPGSASLVARHIDNNRSSLEILGTIAGDDTIFITPGSTKRISIIVKKIKDEF